MATKTLILRPIRVTCSDESLVTPVPEDTTVDNYHLLVNEEEPDDHSTYITLTSPTDGSSTSLSYHFSYKKPIDMSHIVSITYYSRTVRTNAALNSNFVHTLHLKSDYVLSRSDIDTSSYFNEIWLSTTKNDEETVLSEFNTVTDFSVTQSLSALDTQNKGNSVISTTQVYIEIVYESVKIVHIKKDDAWSLVKYRDMYLKDNNTWVKLELLAENIFNNGAKYRVKESD